MSGFEISGVVLGALPIVLKLIEGYRVVYEAFGTYKDHPQAIKQSRDELEIQQRIFQMQLERLFAAAGRRVNDAFFADLSDPLWEDADLNYALSQTLGRAQQPWTNCVEMIIQALDKVHQQQIKFRSVVAKLGPDVQMIGPWHVKIWDRLRFCWKSSEFDKELDRIRKLNEDLRLIWQPENDNSLVKPPTGGTPWLDEESFTSEEKTWKLVERMSQGLYDALSDSCEDHTTHTVQFALGPSVDHPLQAPRFTFDVALWSTERCIAFPWLSIEASCKLHDSHEVEQSRDSVLLPLHSILDNSRKLKNGKDPGKRFKTMLHRLRRQKTEEPAVSADNGQGDIELDSIQLPVEVNAAHAGDLQALPNFSSQKKLCVRLRTCADSPSTASLSCIGHMRLDHPISDMQFLVYVSPGTTDTVSTDLATMLARYASNPLQDIPALDRIRLAKRLSLAVLYHHATPWLKDGSWRSKDIRMLEGRASQARVIDKLYIDVEVCKETGPPPPSLPPVSSGTPVSMSTPIRNQALFGLALVLIELALQCPLEELYAKLKPVLPPSLDPQQLEYALASRVINTWSGIDLTVRFQSIIERCLDCFSGSGAGHSLREAQLQKLFYKYVVCELDAMETDYVSKGFCL